MDERPPVWVGHVALYVSDVEKSAAFWEKIVPRVVHAGPDVSIFELRGGTHMILVPGDVKPGAAPFDLMVDDLDATHAAWSADGLDPSAIETGRIHRGFEVRDPDGYVVTVSNSHVVGPV